MHIETSKEKKIKPKKIVKKTEKPEKNYILFFSCATLVSYLARVPEIFPLLGSIRITFTLFLCTLFFFFRSNKAKDFSLHKNKELKLTLWWIFAGFLSVPFSVWPHHALASCTGTLLANTLVFVFAQTAIQSKKDFFQIINVIVIANLFLLFGMFFKPQIVEGYRITTTNSYDPNDIAMIFVFSFPIILSCFVRANILKKIFYAGVLCVLILAIVKTGSRGGGLALAIAIIGVFFSRSIQLKPLYKVLAVALVIAMFMSPYGDPIRERFDQMASGEDYNMVNTDSTAGGRLAIWKSGFQIFLNNPIIGVGVKSSSTAMGEYYGDDSWKTMHNSFLQIAVEMGIVGFFLYIAMLHQTWRNCQTYLKKHKEKEDIEKMFSPVVAIKIGLYSYIIAAFFLSQAFSVIVPLSLALSSRLDK